MALLSSLYRHGLWVGPAGFTLGVALLVLCIAGVIDTVRRARLLDVPLVASQVVALAEPGPLVLAMEGPVFTRPFAGLEYVLIGPDGHEARRRRALLRATTTGITRGTIELRVFEVAVPGPHTLTVTGLTGARPADAACRIVLKRPNLGRSVLWVIGIVLSAWLTIGSVVLFALRYAHAAD